MKAIKKISALLCVLALGVLASCQKENEPKGNSNDNFKPFYSGVFVLNEGGGNSVQGQLDYICPKNKYVPKMFEKVNKRTLGNVVQDMFISGDRIYIVSQNGDKEVAPKDKPSEKVSGVGCLSILEQSTLKLIKAYKSRELNELNNPSHLAVVKGKVYIRDGKGIYLLDTDTGELTFINGTEGAKFAKLVVLDDKVYSRTEDGKLIIINGITAETKAMSKPIVAMQKTYDGKLWLASETPSEGAITKYDPKTGQELAVHTIAEAKLIPNGWGGAATKLISATQDTIYFASKLQIYRHIFNANKTEAFVTLPKIEGGEQTMIYNGFAVNPENGYLYVATIKGYGWDYLKNSVLAFSPKGELKQEFKNHTAFPAGIYPVASFN